MLISVVGSSGLGRVAGIPAGSPAALLRVIAERPDQQVLVLAPAYAAATARRQADLVAAARPSADLEVLVSRHHALTLTLVAERALAATPWAATRDVASLVRDELATARSLVWCATAWRLGAELDLATRLRSLVGGPGFVLELGHPSRLSDARGGWRLRQGERLYGVDPMPALLAEQLDGCVRHVVDTRVDTAAPYGSRAGCLLTALTLPADSTQAPHPTPANPPGASHDEAAGDHDLSNESEAA